MSMNHDRQRPGEGLRAAIAAMLPAELGREVRANLEAVLSSNLEKMNLASREQLEIQQKVLQRTRARVLELERQVAALEALVEKSTAQN